MLFKFIEYFIIKNIKDLLSFDLSEDENNENEILNDEGNDKGKYNLN